MDWTIGTTYSLDLMAMLAAPVAFAFSDWQDQEGRPIPDPIALLKAVRQYADRMCLFHHAGRIQVPAAYQPLLQTLAYDIRRVAFEVPEPFEDMAFWPIGIDENEDWPFNGMTRRKLIISPFISEGIFDELIGESVNVELVSRADQLELVKPSALQAFKDVWVLDDAAAPEPGDIEQDVTEPDSSATNDLHLSGLHAKVYVMNEGWNASVFTGSANATRAAFYQNVEFLTQLTAAYCMPRYTLGHRCRVAGQAAIGLLTDLWTPK